MPPFESVEMSFIPFVGISIGFGDFLEFRLQMDNLRLKVQEISGGRSLELTEYWIALCYHEIRKLDVPHD